MTHAAGWYPDPSNPQIQRYWDGQQWTQHTQQVPPMVPAKKRRDPIRTILTIAGVILVIVVTVSFFTPSSSDDRPAVAVEVQDDAPSDPDWFNPASYGELSGRDFQLLIKDPEAAAGDKHVIYGEVYQLDAATGDRSMMVYASAEPDALGLGDNVMVNVRDAGLLKPVVSGDAVKLFVTVDGAISYDTQIGGRTTVPEFTAAIVEVLPE